MPVSLHPEEGLIQDSVASVGNLTDDRCQCWQHAGKAGSATFAGMGLRAEYLTGEMLMISKTCLVSSVANLDKDD